MHGLETRLHTLTPIQRSICVILMNEHVWCFLNQLLWWWLGVVLSLYTPRHPRLLYFLFFLVEWRPVAHVSEFSSAFMNNFSTSKCTCWWCHSSTTRMTCTSTYWVSVVNDTRDTVGPPVSRKVQFFILLLIQMFPEDTFCQNGCEWLS